MSTDMVICAEGISKSYRIVPVGHHAWGNGGRRILELLGLSGADRPANSFTALENVDFTVKRGESVGILGRNGSGKSTLLQIIAGTLRPSTGTLNTTGRIAALLELGSGFNPEFTGRENVYLNAAIFGMSKRQIESNYVEIEAFADIGTFIDQPVATYSSGMRMRLAFAVLTRVSPEVLIIDEALSVGDAFFQSKCVRWLESFLSDGGSLVCVSHDMFMLQRICSRGVLLEKGKVIMDGAISEVVPLYYRLQQGGTLATGSGPTGGRNLENKDPSAGLSVNAEGWYAVPLREKERTGNRHLEIKSLFADRDITKGVQVGEWVRFEVTYESHREMDYYHLGIGFRDRSGQLVGGYHSMHDNQRLPPVVAGQEVRLCVEIQMMMKPRIYLLMVGLAIDLPGDFWEDLDCFWDCARIVVEGDKQFWGIAFLPYRGLVVEAKK